MPQRPAAHFELTWKIREVSMSNMFMPYSFGNEMINCGFSDKKKRSEYFTFTLICWINREWGSHQLHFICTTSSLKFTQNRLLRFHARLWSVNWAEVSYRLRMILNFTRIFQTEILMHIDLDFPASISLKQIRHAYGFVKWHFRLFVA